MSASVMGAVMRCGPTRVRLRLALAGIADNADDFGFAQLSIATIASKSLCDERTAMRVVRELEREQWLTVHRRVVDGKSSVYVVNVDKLGIVPDQKSRKSEWHVKFERGAKLRSVAEDDSFEPKKKQKSGDKMSPDSAVEPRYDPKSLKLIDLVLRKNEEQNSGDILSPELADSPFLSPESGDNSQGVQVTFSGGSGDILPIAIWKNHRTIRNPDLPPTPLQGDAREVGEDLLQEWRGWWEMANRIRQREGKPLLGWEKFYAREKAEWDRANPPKPAPDPEFARCSTAREAANLVARRCSLIGERLAVVIAAAIESGRIACVDLESVGQVGELAWRNFMAYQREAGTMRYTWGPRNFFAGGHWLRPNSWPREKQRSRL